jgi:hypothetical protein
VLLIVWNRPFETRLALERLRESRPSELYVAGDGPRNDDDAKLVAEVRRIIEEFVDWPCTLQTSFSNENLGCRGGVTRAIDWFFSRVDEGIILEDDCVAGPDFFAFCDEMLERYRHDHRVMHIAGDNTARIRISQDWSYCFVRYPHIWGWATWKRAWLEYDRDLAVWDHFRAGHQVIDLFPNADERETWVPILDRLRDTGRPDTWDWQWAVTCMALDALCIQPTVNLVSNIGFNGRATHTKRPSVRSNMPPQPIFPLRHPPLAYRHHDADRQIFLNTQIGLRAKSKGRVWIRVSHKIKASLLKTRLGIAWRQLFRSTDPD